MVRDIKSTELRRAENEINNLPMECRGWRRPNEIMFEK
jgi:IS30 family transposase